MEYTTLPIIRCKRLSSDFYEVVLRKKREMVGQPGQQILARTDKNRPSDYIPHFIASGIQEPWMRIFVREPINETKLRIKPTLASVFSSLSQAKYPVFICEGLGIAPFYSFISTYPSEDLDMYIIGDNIPNLEWAKSYSQAQILSTVDIIGDKVSSPDRDYYVCMGTDDSVQAVKLILASAGIPADKIFTAIP